MRSQHNKMAFGMLPAVIGILCCLAAVAYGRIKLVALPERAATIVRLDNPLATLVEEERVLTLQQGLNRIDFAWTGVSIDVDSIRLRMLDNPDDVTLLNVSYPPNEAALVWELHSDKARQETARISYLLRDIDRLVTYKAIANNDETALDLKSYVILRNFSGEDLDNARVMLDYGQAFDRGIKHEETSQLLFFKQPDVPITKVWTFDSAIKPWDPEELDGNVGIPVSYRIANTTDTGLGNVALWGGKARLYQDDGHESTIFLGEDHALLTPVGEKMELYIGDSRDIVVTQRKMKDEQINIRRNDSQRIVLFDTDEVITAKIENFKDSSATLTMIQHIPGEWEMADCNMAYTRDDASTLKFEITLPPRNDSGPATEKLRMHYHRRNIRSNQPRPLSRPAPARPKRTRPTRRPRERGN